MPLNLTLGSASAGGFGFKKKPFFTFLATISSSRSTYNVYDAAIAAGWNGIIPLLADISINSGIVLSGTGNGTSAAFVINNLPIKSIVTINNSGTITGIGGSAGSKTSNSSAESYPGNYTGSFVTPNYANGFDGSGYPTGYGAGGSTPGYNTFSGGTTSNAGAGTAGTNAIYLASNATLIINNSSTGLATGGGGGAGGQAGNNAGGGAGANGGYLIEETGSHPAAIVNNISGGIVASGGGGSGGWGNRYEGDGIGGRLGYAAKYTMPTGGNYGGSGSSPGLATNNTGNTLVNTTGQFTLSPAV